MDNTFINMSIDISCRDDIIDLPDIRSLCVLKQQWNLKSDGRPLKHRDDYVRLLLEHYDRIHGHTQVRELKCCLDFLHNIFTMFTYIRFMGMQMNCAYKRLTYLWP